MGVDEDLAASRPARLRGRPGGRRRARSSELVVSSSVATVSATGSRSCRSPFVLTAAARSTAPLRAPGDRCRSAVRSKPAKRACGLSVSSARSGRSTPSRARPSGFPLEPQLDPRGRRARERAPSRLRQQLTLDLVRRRRAFRFDRAAPRRMARGRGTACAGLAPGLHSRRIARRRQRSPFRRSSSVFTPAPAPAPQASRACARFPSPAESARTRSALAACVVSSTIARTSKSRSGCCRPAAGARPAARAVAGARSARCPLRSRR